MTARTKARVRALRRSIVVGAVLALLLAAAGVGFALTRQRLYTAESVVVVLPNATLDNVASAAYYETLSRGQIVATFAEVAGNLRFEQQAEDRLGLTPAERASASTEVTVVPDTAVILIRTTADTAVLAERLADAVTALSSDYWSGLSRPYRTQTVGSAIGSSERSGSSPLVLAAAAVLVGLVAGLAAQQAIYHLMTALRPPEEAAPDAPRQAGAAAASGPADPEPADRAPAPVEVAGSEPAVAEQADPEPGDTEPAGADPAGGSTGEPERVSVSTSTRGT